MRLTEKDIQRRMWELKHFDRKLPTATKAQLNWHLAYQRVYAVADRAKETIEFLLGIAFLQFVAILVLVILLNGGTK